MDRDQGVEFREIESGLLWAEITDDSGVEEVMVIDKNGETLLIANHEQFGMLLQDIVEIARHIKEGKDAAD